MKTTHTNPMTETQRAELRAQRAALAAAPALFSCAGRCGAVLATNYSFCADCAADELARYYVGDDEGELLSRGITTRDA